MGRDAELRRGVISIAASALGNEAEANQTTANANMVNSTMRFAVALLTGFLLEIDGLEMLN